MEKTTIKNINDYKLLSYKIFKNISIFYDYIPVFYCHNKQKDVYNHSYLRFEYQSLINNKYLLYISYCCISSNMYQEKNILVYLK